MLNHGLSTPDTVLVEVLTYMCHPDAGHKVDVPTWPHLVKLGQELANIRGQGHQYLMATNNSWFHSEDLVDHLHITVHVHWAVFHFHLRNFRIKAKKKSFYF